MGKALEFLVSLLLLRLTTGKTIVTHLPGYDGRLPFELETGYVVVDELHKANLFYTFVESERSPADDPVMIWINGGPGCTGLGKLTNGFGPFSVIFNGSDIDSPLVLVLREESWTKMCSIIFVDSPVGTGYSYSEVGDRYELSDNKASKDLHVFMRKWFLDHPEFISNPFYVGGDSYGGKIVPVLTQEILMGNDDGAIPFVNVKGYVVGNPFTGDNAFDRGTLVEYSHGMGLISDELYQETKDNCDGDYVTPRNIKCEKCLDEVDKHLAGLNKNDILLPVSELICPKLEQSLVAGRYLTETDLNHHHSFGDPQEGCEEFKNFPGKLWADSHVVREALGVHKEYAHEWLRCDEHIRDNYTLNIVSAIPYHLNLMSRGLRSLVYSGDHDTSVNFRGTHAWIRSFNFSILEDWQPWLVDGQVAGYKTIYANNVTFTTVKGAGHVVCYTKLKESRDLFERWIYGQTI